MGMGALLHYAALARLSTQLCSSARGACSLNSPEWGVQVDFEELSEAALAAGDPGEGLPSGQAELYEIWLSRYIK